MPTPRRKQNVACPGQKDICSTGFSPAVTASARPSKNIRNYWSLLSGLNDHVLKDDEVEGRAKHARLTTVEPGCLRLD